MALPPLLVDENTFTRGRCALPALPVVIGEVLAAAQDDRANPEHVAAIITRDASFSTHVLAVVNSAYYALPSPVSNIRFAIAFLGLAELSRIAIALSAVNTLEIKDTRVLRDFWIHSHLSALVAKRVLKEFSFPTFLEDLHAAALLHRIGSLVYARFYPEHFTAISRHREEHGCFSHQAEHALDLPTQGSFGALACQSWGLPKPIQRACEFHGPEHIQQLETLTTSDPMDVVITVSHHLCELALYELNGEARTQAIDDICRVLEYPQDGFLMLLGDVYELRSQAEQEIQGLV